MNKKVLGFQSMNGGFQREKEMGIPACRATFFNGVLICSSFLCLLQCDGVGCAMIIMLPLIMTQAFMMSSITTIMSIGLEKERGIKEGTLR